MSLPVSLKPHCWIAGVLLSSLFVVLPFQVSASVSLDASPGKTNSQTTLNSTDELFAQTSEITIRLEKKIRPPQSSQTQDAGEEAPRTASRPLSSTQRPETYEELEDPFAKERELPEIGDPFEGYNRFMYDVNEGIYDYFMEPVARSYRYVLPEDIRLAIRNLFDNALSPVKFVSSLIQGDLDKSGRVLGRVIINTTLGIGGLFDVAGKQFDIKNVNEDFDQALGYHGVPTGPYIVLPFLGPSSVRNLTGRAVDSLLSPTVMFSPSFLVGAGITLEANVNELSFVIEDKKQLEEGAVDEYISMRDFYHQYREGLVND